MQWVKRNTLNGFFLVCVLIPGLYKPLSGRCEGTRQLNSNNVQSTQLYLCNDFAGHCTSSAGVRSQFATYDNSQSAGDVDRLYFVTTDASEVVYMGFNGSSLTNPLRHIVFRIKNLAGAIVFGEQNLPTSGTGYISLFSQAWNGPNQLILTPPTNGYDALTFTPPTPGTYYIEFSQKRDDNNNFYIGNFNLILFDLTVGNTVTHLAKPGRLYSKCWQFYETSNFYGINYVISDDSIVTSAQFSGMSGGHWNQYCNQSGCGNSSANWLTSRMSLYQQQALYPQYKTFLNSPDPLIFPSATTAGQFVAPMPYGVQNCVTGHILFHIKVNKPGNAELTMTFPSPYQTRVLNQAVVAGDNLFDWDGLDGTLPTGMPVPNNTPILFTVKYIAGLTNLPLYDVEGNTSGFTIALVSPAGSTPSVFWDDTNIPGGVNNSTLPGCTSPPGCHSWSSSGGSGFGDLNTMNTWWYNVSTSTTPVIIYEFRGPESLSFVQEPPQSFCANTGGHIFSVLPDSNTDVYHWSYIPSTGVTIAQATPASYTVTVSFSSGASSGTLKVYGSNTNCSMNGPEASMPITINPLPVPTLTGPASVCTGQTGVTYTTEAGKNFYQWFVSPGGTPTTGGTNISNTVTVTWNTAGAQSVSVNYQNPGTFCTAITPTAVAVTVHSRPVPVLSGPSLACVGSGGLVYTTDPGKTGYVWTVSSGGLPTAGGTSTSSTVTVTWNTVGPQLVSVSYTDPVTLCAASSPTQLNVTVSTLPSPSFLSGSTSACQGVPGNVYTTQSGMSNYIWSITGGLINLGGSAFDPYANVTWNTTGIQSISVNYTLPSSTCTAPVPATMNVNVKPLPAPTFISGENPACINVPGQVYTTQPGMLNYFWSATGGNIMLGGGLSDNYATVTWTSAGLQSIQVNYTDPGTNCTAAVPAVFPVTVKPSPVPTFILGESPVCINDPGQVYVTQPGMSFYSWSITGGNITAGGGIDDDSATVTWNTTGIQSISVGYTNPATQCISAVPATFSVTVKPRPSPTFLSGVSPVCRNAPGNMYTTQAGMSGYIWTITGGSINSGGNFDENFASVTWNISGNQSISVSYVDPLSGCRAAAPVVYPVLVNPLPVPTITGPSQTCLNVAGNQYNTEGGMSGYLWTVPGGTISTTPDPSVINVTWNTTGVHTMLVTYTNLNGCNPENSTQKSVLVNTLPVPGLTGQTTICSGLQTSYTTEGGMGNYTWSVSPGTQVLDGGSSVDSSITVSWATPGTKHVSVNYTLGTGCTASSPTDLTITVNPTVIPVIQQNPEGQVCLSKTSTYTTQPGMQEYSWAVSVGGEIISSQTTNEIVVKWNNTGPQWVSVNFVTWPDLCTAPASSIFEVTVNPLPVTNITSGPGLFCESLRSVYDVPPDTGCTFNWTVGPAGLGTVTTGQGSNEAVITWQSHGTALVSVTGTNNTTGCLTSSSLTTTVNPKPEPAFMPCFDVVTTPNAKKFVLMGAAPTNSGKGVFTGYGVSLNSSTGMYEFDPLGAVPGTYEITYTYTNTFGCPASPPGVSITVQNNPFSCGGTLTDIRDGRPYATALFGGKCWMIENLNFGGIIDRVQPSTDNCIIEKYCPPTDAGCTRYGGLYQWNELMQHGYTSDYQGICPPEWHVPSETEWAAMLTGLNTGITPPDGVAGGFMKDINRPGGFHSRQGGLLYFNQTWSFIAGYLTGTMYWTNTSEGVDQAVARGVNEINFSTSRYSSGRANAFSVRCIKD